MTNLNIDSQSVNFDRRTALNCMGPFTVNDQIINDAVFQYEKYEREACRQSRTDEEIRQLVTNADNAAEVLVTALSDSIIGIDAKARWLRMPENYNEGSFGEEYLNGRILLSLFSDIERLGAISSNILLNKTSLAFNHPVDTL